MKNWRIKQNTGFTILEMMISIGIFTILIVFGVGSLLNANLLHNKSQDMRDIMDNLSFIMEDMSRNIRTGYDYRCFFGTGANQWDINEVQAPDLEDPRSCPPGGTYVGHALAFEEARFGTESNVNDQWVYSIQYDSVDDSYDIFKSIDGGDNFVQMNLAEIQMLPSSGIVVIGAEAPSTGGGGDEQQPWVTIRLAGVINYKSATTPFDLQTTVSQRLIDSETE